MALILIITSRRSYPNRPLMKRAIMKVACATLIFVCTLSLATFKTQAQTPELVTQAGHAEFLISAAFNPDGSLYATGDGSGIVKLWDARGGRLLRTIGAHAGRVTSLVFSSDGRALVTESMPGTSSVAMHADSTLKLWDVRTGRMLLKVEAGPFAVSPVQHILATSEGRSIKLWDTHDGRLLRTLTGHTLPVATIKFSADGRLLGSTGAAEEKDAGAGEAGDASSVQKKQAAPPAVDNARLWDVEGGKLVAESNGCKETIFNPDGSLIADKEGNLCEVKTGRLLRNLGGRFAAFSPDGATVVFFEAAKTFEGTPADVYKTPAALVVSDVRGGTIRKRIEGFIAPLTTVSSFGPEGGTLIISGVVAADDKQLNVVEAWDTNDWRRLYRLEDHYVDAVSPKSDFYTAARSTADYKTEFSLREARTGRLVRVVAPSANYTEASNAFSPDGGTFALNSEDSLSLFDLPGGNLRHGFRGSSEYVPALAFSPDGKMFAVIRGNEDINNQRYELWETRSGSLTANVKSHHASEEMSNDDWRALGFTRDGQTLFTPDGSLRDTRTGAGGRKYNGVFATAASLYAVAGTSGVELHAAGTDRLLRRLTTPNVSRIALSPDGKLLAVGFGFGEIGARLNLYNATTGRFLRKLAAVDDLTNALEFSRNGRLLAVTYGSGSAEFVTNAIFDAATGRRLTTFFDKSESEEASVNRKRFLAFSPDGHLAVLQGRVENTVELRDTKTGKIVKTIGGVTPFAESAAFSPDGKILATGDGDTGVRFWYAESGELLGTLLSFEGGDWLAATPDGLFDGSPAAWNRMLWRFSGDTFNVAPAEIFFGDFYSPGLLGEIFAGRRPRASAGIADKDRRQPRVTLELAGARSGATDVPVDTRNITLRISVAEAAPDATHTQGSGAQDVRLFRNGTLVKVWRGDVLAGKSSASLEAVIPVIAGENRFTAYAFNHDNVKSADSSLALVGADSLKRKGVAYVLAVGVNKYANANYNLRYAVADAQAFAGEWRRQQEGLNRYERVETTLLLDQDATKAKILAAFSKLAERMQPEDSVVVYFASHGTAYREQFYLLPHDLGYAGARDSLDQAGIETIIAHSVSDRELEDAFEKINAARILFVIDACNSGQALEAEERRRGPMNSKGLAQLAYEKGMYILTAAQSFEAAQEAAQVGHGLLTYALVEEGLKGSAADREPQDGEIRVREWLDYATRRVPEMQVAEMKRAFTRGTELSFADDERGLSIRRRSGQRPRVFYRRELEAQPLVVARPKDAPAVEKQKTTEPATRRDN